MLKFQYGGQYDARASVDPSMIKDVEAILSAEPDGLTYLIQLNFIDPKPK